MSKGRRAPSQKRRVHDALSLAVAHHRADRLGEAESLYREVLDVEPDNAQALHMLGVVGLQYGDCAAAIELIGASVAVDPDDAAAQCDLGVAHKMMGDFDAAADCYRRAIAIAPDYVQAHNNLGNTLQATGLLDEAAECYRRALALNADHVSAWSNLGFVLRNMGRTCEAADACRRAIALQPDFADAHGNLGLALQDRGDLAGAEDSFRRAVALAPDDPEAHNNLGNALHALRCYEAALECYRQALALFPEFVDAHNNLGNVCHELERFDEAEESYRRALALDPENIDACNNLGLVCQDRSAFGDAVAHYRRALAIDETYANVHSNLGLALNAVDEPEAALEHFDRYLALTRGPEVIGPTGQGFRTISKPKIDHDIEQYRYLQAIGHEPERFASLADAYEALRDDIDWPRDGGHLVDLTEAQYDRIADSYNRPIARTSAPRVAGSALNATLDAGAVTRDYFDNAPGMTFVDGVLSTAALDGLRRYLLESTIWFDFRYHHGYLGAFLHDGLACPLVLQIAEDFRCTLPEIFGEHRLLQCWAYKYDSRLKGIDVHADAAAVNVNFWVTPDSANLDPASGGLIVHKVEAPLHWRFEAYNTDQARIRGFLAENDRGRLVVPHAQNRAVLFNSDLFHETDTIAFREGYENRRINVTMLFGRRQD